jgi:hypothetical protein
MDCWINTKFKVQKVLISLWWELEDYCTLDQWFSNGGPQEVARILWKYTLKIRRNPFLYRFIIAMIFIFIHSLKYINIFLILYTKCARNFLCFTVCREPKTFENHCSRMWCHVVWKIGTNVSAAPSTKVNSVTFQKARIVIHTVFRTSNLWGSGCKVTTYHWTKR